MKGQAIAQGLADANLDGGQRDRLLAKADQIEKDPRLPVYQTDIAGNPVYGPDGRRVQVAGAVNVDASKRNADGSIAFGGAVLAPGWHFTLDDTAGKTDWGLVNEADAGYPPGAWALNHIQVVTGAFGQRVVGDVKVQDAPTSLSVGIRVQTQNGEKFIPYTQGAKFLTYIDGYGNRVNGYSVDNGKTWVMATGGVLPSLELAGKVTWTEKPDGSVEITDGASNVLFRSADGVSWESDLAKPMVAGAIGWFGQAAAQSGTSTAAGVGAPGQQFRLVYAYNGTDGMGALNLTPREILYSEATAASAAETARRTVAVGSAQEASLAEESAAIRARGRVPVPIPQTDPTMYRRQGYADYAAKLAKAEAATARLQVGQSLEDETAAIQARQSPGAAWRQVGAMATAMIDQVTPIFQGIITIGNTIMAAASPPTYLPAPYIAPIVGFTLPSLRPVTPIALPKVPVTTPITIKKGVTPTPSGDENRIYEPAPKPAPKPAPAPAPARPIANPIKI